MLFNMLKAIKPIFYQSKTPAFNLLKLRYLSNNLTNKLTLYNEDEHGVRKITLNNPKKRNALSFDMLNCLKEDLLKESEKLRAIVIKANGPVFSSGHDLKELQTNEESKVEHHQDVFELCSNVMTLLKDLPVPVIAQVHGLATAAGCQLVASCDIAVSSDNAQFATPGVTTGLFCSTPAVALGRSVPKKIALYMLFTGFSINAQEALMHGLVTKVVPLDKLDLEVEIICKKICQSSKPVLKLGKRVYHKQISLDIESAYKLTNDVMVNNLKYEDAKEGLSSFFEKRTPVWKQVDDEK